MDNLAQLETYSNELATAIKSLASYSQDDEIRQAKENILSKVFRIKALVSGPTDLLHHLASQNEMLACLRWLGEFQVLACIPQTASVPIKDIAALSGVPEQQLARVVRLTATAGFLHESDRGHVAHTTLSAPFVTNPALLDAAMFLAESAAPAALQMAPATHRFGASHRPTDSAYNLTLNTTTPFHTARQERPKLNRQWLAYLQYAAGLHAINNVVDSLAQLNWSNVGAQSTSVAQCLAELYPALHFSVQINDLVSATSHWTRLNSLPSGQGKRADREPELSPRVTVTTRTLGTRQTITDAIVYILHVTSLSPSAILTELQVHLGVLRASSGIMLLLTARLLPEPGSVPDPEIEAMARSRDLTLLQLSNECEMEMVELLEIIDSVRDNMGKLVVINRLRSRNHLVVALVVKYNQHPS